MFTIINQVIIKWKTESETLLRYSVIAVATAMYLPIENSLAIVYFVPCSKRQENLLVLLLKSPQS